MGARQWRRIDLFAKATSVRTVDDAYACPARYHGHHPGAIRRWSMGPAADRKLVRIPGPFGLQIAPKAISARSWRQATHDHQGPHGRGRVCALVSDTGG